MTFFGDAFVWCCEIFLTILAGGLCVVAGLAVIVVVVVIIKVLIETIIEWRRKNK